MVDGTLEDITEDLAARLVAADPNDPEALADLAEGFRSIEEGDVPCGDVAPETLTAVVEALEAAASGQGGDADAALMAATCVVTALQDVARNQRASDGDESQSRPDHVEPQTASTDNDDTGPDAPTGPAELCHPTSLPDNIDAAIFTEFLDGQGPALDEMEVQILAVEKGEDGDALAAVKRALHTLKGEAGLLGLEDVERLCHAAEDMLVDSEPADAAGQLLAVTDWLRSAFDCYSGAGPAPAPVESLTASLQAASSHDEQDPDQEQAQTLPQQDESVEAKAPEPEVAEPATRNLLDDDVELLGDFVAEADEHLEASDMHLLTLETEPDDEEAMNAVFRAFHTIKGLAGFMDLGQVQTLSHKAESLLDLARKGELVLAGAAIDTVFDSVDMLKKLVLDVRTALTGDGMMTERSDIAGLLSRLDAIAAGDAPSDSAPLPPVAPGMKVGEILVEAGKVTEEEVEAALEQQQSPPAARDVGDIVLEAAMASRKQVEAARAQNDEDPDGPDLAELLLSDGAIDEQEAEAARLRAQESPRPPKIGQQLAKHTQVSPKEVARAVRSQKSASRQSAVRVREAVRVDAERLDRLVETIGEMVIAESMVSQSVDLRNASSAQLARQLDQLDKITRGLQEIGMSLRMVPIQPTFQKMARLVRDLAKKGQKRVDFVMSGEETELDKTVVDRIGDPLVHMVRNAVDHGVESPEQRRAAGKPETGRVELRAFHKGGNIFIELEDDGKGLDREAILAKAKERGMIDERSTLSDREIFNLIFEAGFSTAQKVTDLSGRGVGMDVVRRNIEALRGQVEIRSEKGKGSTFSIRLPLTLAIIDGMVIRVGAERYIIPMLSILQSIRPGESELSTVLQRGEMMKVQGNLIPLLRLSKLFNIEGAEEDLTKALVVVVEDDGRQVGLVTDELLGQQQIVIKALGEDMRTIPGLAGGAIMPDGRVGLILDVGGIAKLAKDADRIPVGAAEAETVPVLA